MAPSWMRSAGINCPLGWPAAFVEFVRAQHTGHVTAPKTPSAGSGRRLAVRGQIRAPLDR
ncbi:hypothetical protein WEI85_19695 [Actinomycetes bacterium KLBMP 9797]